MKRYDLRYCGRGGFDAAAAIEYSGSMKVKTSITLSEDLLAVVDERAKWSKKSRSDFIEDAVRAFLVPAAREERNARDLEILNQHAGRLAREALDVLEYQVPL